jgi:hypothetical protein
MDVTYVKSTSTITLFRLRNNNPGTATLTRIEIDWPGENDALFNTILNGRVIWVGEDLVPPTIISSWYGEPSDREVGGTMALEFFFGTPASEQGYRLQISFGNGCTIGTTN